MLFASLEKVAAPPRFESAVSGFPFSPLSPNDRLFRGPLCLNWSTCGKPLAISRTPPMGEAAHHSLNSGLLRHR
jgi:hypothetical protein